MILYASWLCSSSSFFCMREISKNSSKFSNKKSTLYSHSGRRPGVEYFDWMHWSWYFMLSWWVIWSNRMKNSSSSGIIFACRKTSRRNIILSEITIERFFFFSFSFYIGLKLFICFRDFLRKFSMPEFEPYFFNFSRFKLMDLLLSFTF